MISYLEGTIHHVDIAGDLLVVLVAGVGYDVHVPSNVTERIKPLEVVTLYTYQQVREDALELFGFLKKEELDFFKQLLTVSGVGPRLAVTVLSRMSVEEIKRAIIHGDVAMLTSLRGVGRKTAERIILDLRGSIDIDTTSGNVVTGEAVVTKRDMTAIDALEALGYTKAEALDALRGVNTALPIEEQVKLALRNTHR